MKTKLRAFNRIFQKSTNLYSYSRYDVRKLLSASRYMGESSDKKQQQDHTVNGSWRQKVIDIDDILGQLKKHLNKVIALGVISFLTYCGYCLGRWVLGIEDKKSKKSKIKEIGEINDKIEKLFLSGFSPNNILGTNADLRSRAEEVLNQIQNDRELRNYFLSEETKISPYNLGKAHLHELLNYLYLIYGLANFDMYHLHNGNAAYSKLLVIKGAVENYLQSEDKRFNSQDSYTELLKNAEERSTRSEILKKSPAMYMELSKYRYLTEAYTRILYPLGRVYMYESIDAKDAKEYFKVSHWLSERVSESRAIEIKSQESFEGPLFEAHLALANGLWIIEREEVEYLQGSTLEKVASLRSIIKGYKARIGDNTGYKRDFDRTGQFEALEQPSANKRVLTDCSEQQIRCYKALIGLDMAHASQNLDRALEIFSKIELLVPREGRDQIDSKKVNNLSNILANILLATSNNKVVLTPTQRTIISDWFKKAKVDVSIPRSQRGEELELQLKIAEGLFKYSSENSGQYEHNRADAHWGMAKLYSTHPNMVQDSPRHIRKHTDEARRISLVLKRGAGESILERREHTKTMERLLLESLESMPPCGTSIIKQYGGFWKGYYPEAISLLLSLRLLDEDVTASKELFLYDGYINDSDNILGTDKFTEQLELVINRGIVEQATNPKSNKIVVPIVYKTFGKPAHWIGLIFNIQNDNNSNTIHATYIDPENNLIPDALLHALSSVLPIDSFIHIEQRYVKEQSYCNNCGPELIEHIAHELTGFRVLEEYVAEFHSSLLEQYLIRSAESSQQVVEPNDDSIITDIANTVHTITDTRPILYLKPAETIDAIVLREAALDSFYMPFMELMSSMSKVPAALLDAWHWSGKIMSQIQTIVVTCTPKTPAVRSNLC